MSIAMGRSNARPLFKAKQVYGEFSGWQIKPQFLIADIPFA